MIIHLPPIYAGLAQYDRLARPIEGIRVVTMTDLTPFLNPWNPATGANIRLIKDSVALGIAHAKHLVGLEPLNGRFELVLLDSDEEMRKVRFIWTFEDDDGAEAARETEALCAPAA